jgi:enediyne core biosynthesis thioesterase
MPFVHGPQGIAFEYCFTTTFEETNLVGNIYFANYARWQGKCREMFLQEYCPDVIDQVHKGLALITLDLHLRYISQLFAFDKVIMRMSLGSMASSRMMMLFKYYKAIRGGEELVCEGSQAMACMRADAGGRMVAAPIPESIFEVFNQFGVVPVAA